MENDIIGAFQAATSFVGEQFPNTLKFLFNHTIKTPVWLVGGIGSLWLYDRVKTRKALRNIRLGNFSGSEAVMGPTVYKKTVVDGEIFFDQTILSDEQAFDIGQFFSSKSRREILNIIDEASGYCTRERPSPFQHLDTVLRARKYKGSEEQIKSAITRGWKNGIGSMMRANPNFFPERFDELRDSDLETGMVIPILVKEPDARTKQYRVLFFTRPMLEQVLDIQQEQIRVMKGRTHVVDDRHPHYMRFATNGHLARHYFENLDWWEDNFGVLFSKPYEGHVQPIREPVGPE